MPEKGNLTECPDCGGQVSKTAKSCPHCGRELKKERKSQGSSLGGGCLTVIFIFIVLGVIGSMVSEDGGSGGSGESDSGPDLPTESQATSMCHDFAEKRLKAPSTAEFPWSANKVLSNQDGETYRFVVHTYVDAENAMGAQLRKDIRCVLETEEGSDQWTLEQISFQ